MQEHQANLLDWLCSSPGDLFTELTSSASSSQGGLALALKVWLAPAQLFLTLFLSFEMEMFILAIVLWDYIACFLFLQRFRAKSLPRVSEHIDFGLLKSAGISDT